MSVFTRIANQWASECNRARARVDKFQGSVSCLSITGFVVCRDRAFEHDHALFDTLKLIARLNGAEISATEHETWANFKSRESG